MAIQDLHKHSRSLKFRRGFTILEMLIYTAIVGMILGTTIYVTSTMYNVRARVNSSSIVHESMEYAEKRILIALHGATAVTIPSSGATTTLQLTMPNAALDPTIFSLSGGQIWIKEGTQQALPLTSGEVKISTLLFIRGTGIPPMIKIQMSGDRLNAKAAFSAPLTLTTSGVIRLEQ